MHGQLRKIAQIHAIIINAVKMKKSQIAIEFAYFVGVAVVILLFYLGLSSTFFSFNSFRRDALSAQNFLEEIRNEINLAGRVEDGYSKIIKFPKQINNKDYLMEINGREIYIEFPKGKNIAYSRILAADVKDAYNEKITFEQGASYKIEKADNEVIIAKQ